MTVEEDRAAEYRRMMTARARNKRAAEKRLAGDPAAKAQLVEDTKALLAYDEHGVPRVGVRR